MKCLFSYVRVEIINLCDLNMAFGLCSIHTKSVFFCLRSDVYNEKVKLSSYTSTFNDIDDAQRQYRRESQRRLDRRRRFVQKSRDTFIFSSIFTRVQSVLGVFDTYRSRSDRSGQSFSIFHLGFGLFVIIKQNI